MQQKEMLLKLDFGFFLILFNFVCLVYEIEYLLLRKKLPVAVSVALREMMGAAQKTVTPQKQ